MSTTWIKRSDREPTDADLPIQCGNYAEGGKWVDWTESWPMAHCFGTHWRSIKAEPPPRELTQREKDDNAVFDICSKLQPLGSTRAWMHKAAMDAIYAERREVDRLLTNWFGANWTTESFTKETSLGQLRARLDEQGGGK